MRLTHLLGLVLAVTSCQGSDNDSSKTLSGKVIDGYISGATVWLDTNANGELDPNEPSAISTKAGEYKLELNAADRDCADYAPLMVHVPVGAIDETEGEVEEAYLMSFPPKYSLDSLDDVRHVTPFTTVIWDQVQAELRQDVPSTCAELKGSHDKRERIKELIRSSVDAMVTTYNISESDLFTDFIADGDQEQAETAVQLVTSFKAAFSYSLQLQQKYPQNTYIRVSFHKTAAGTKDTYDHLTEVDRWYRDAAIWADGSFVFEYHRLLSPESVQATPIYLRRSSSQAWGKQGKYWTTTDAIILHDRGVDSWSCHMDYRYYWEAQRKGYSTSQNITKEATDDPLVCLNNPDSLTNRGPSQSIRFSIDARLTQDSELHLHFNKPTEDIQPGSAEADFLPIFAQDHDFKTFEPSTLTSFLDGKSIWTLEKAENSVINDAYFDSSFLRMTTYPLDEPGIESRSEELHREGEDIYYSKHTYYQNLTHQSVCSEDRETWYECTDEVPLP